LKLIEIVQTPLAVRATGPNVTKIWLAMLAVLGMTLLLAALLT